MGRALHNSPTFTKWTDSLKIKVLFLKYGIRWQYPYVIVTSILVWKSIANAVRQENEIEVTEIKKRNKLFLFVNYIIFYIKI